MPNGQPRRQLDASRAKELFGFRAATALRDGLSSTIAWYRDARRGACAASAALEQRSRLRDRGDDWWILAALRPRRMALRRRARRSSGAPTTAGSSSDGDDGPWYWTSAWALTSLHVPPTAVGLGWPYLLTPLAAIFGPNMANGLPAVIALNSLVLAPAAVIGMYLLGERIAGRLFGLWAAFLWVILPGLALLLYPREDAAVGDRLVPPDCAPGSTPCPTSRRWSARSSAAYLLFRALDSNDVQSGVLCGFVLGFLVLLKPANGPLLVAGVVVLAVDPSLPAH